MSVLKFRVVLDVQENVFRDIEILNTQTFEDLQKAIINSFGFTGQQMSSFYMSNDEWDKGQEITLVDMGLAETPEEAPLLMSDTTMHDQVIEDDEKIIFVYDFMNMWCFFVELIGSKQEDTATVYPRIAVSVGTAPAEDSKAPPETMQGESTNISEDYNLGDDEDLYGDSDMFSSLDDLDEDLY